MKIAACMTVFFFLIMGSYVSSAEESSSKSDNKAQVKGGFFVNYKPPHLGKPDRRVGGCQG